MPKNRNMSFYARSAAGGKKGTPFGRCVSHGAKLLRDQKAQDEEGEH